MSNGPQFLMIGSTHTDMAWKRDQDELSELYELMIVRVLDLLDHHPQFTYVVEQAAHLRALAARRPDLIARLIPYLRAGRLELVGGMATTLETNAPNGESFIRNLLLGLRWVKENLDVPVRTGWLIDTFGLHAQLPQIFRQFGIERVMANRFGGVMETDVFYSQGLDGSRILIAGRDVYAPYVRPDHLLFFYFQTWEDFDRHFNRVQKLNINGPFAVMPYTENEFMPTFRILQQVEQRQQMGEKWVFATPCELFDALQATGEDFPIFHGDLNPEFTATFSQRVNIRLRNRRSETALLEAEKWAVSLGLQDWQPHTEDAWWRMAFNHFHDVFTGSHPTRVYRRVLGNFDNADISAATIMERAANKAVEAAALDSASTGGQGSTLVAFNGLPWLRREVVAFQLPKGMQGARVSAGSQDLPVQVENGWARFPAVLPAGGYRTFAVLPLAEDPAPPQPVEVESATIENSAILLECDTVNGIRRLVRKSSAESSGGMLPLLENAGDFLVVQQDTGSFQIEHPVGGEITARSGRMRLHAYPPGPLGQRVKLSGSFPQLPWMNEPSQLDWEADLTLLPGDAPLRLDLRLIWKGETARVRLKLASTLQAAEAIYEIPFGAVTRRPYGVRGTARGEWPAQRFVTLQEPERGLALINTGAHGVETAGGILWNSLLRAPASEYAGMVADDTSSQHGEHHFTFAILPYAGHWQDAGLLAAAQALNNPVQAVLRPGMAEPVETSLFALSPDTVVLSTIKGPEAGGPDRVVRFYEATGQPTTATLLVRGATRAWSSDVREARGEPVSCVDGVITADLQPFEIKTVLVE